MITDLRHDPVVFRAALRDWLAAILPTGLPDDVARLDEDDQVALQRWWMAERERAGLAVPHWPSEYGGVDLDLSGQIILADEFARAGAPALDMFIVSLNHIPGTLIPFGTPEQKGRYLPAIPRGAIWCQGFSEPGAGSDLAALSCRAQRDGDHYVVDGQKTWSSFSRFAQHCILLVRTDPSAQRHAGISFLILDMDTPGLDIRPIRQINGDSEFSELFLSEVRIPVTNLVGAENDGWRVTQATLASERGVLWFDWAERRRYAIETYYAQALADDAAWLHDDELRRAFMMLFAEMQSGRRLIRQLLEENMHDHNSPTMTSAYVKLVDTTLRQRLADLRVRIDGLEGQFVQRRDGHASSMADFLSSYAGTISGGTNEIMRNLIAERALGLPRG